jgi:hypothetical protein
METKTWRRVELQQSMKDSMARRISAALYDVVEMTCQSIDHARGCHRSHQRRAWWRRPERKSGPGECGVKERERDKVEGEGWRGACNATVRDEEKKRSLLLLNGRKVIHSWLVKANK